MHPALHSIYRIILIDSFRRAGLCCTVPKRLSMKFNPDQERRSLNLVLSARLNISPEDLFLTDSVPEINGHCHLYGIFVKNLQANSRTTWRRH